MNKVNATSPNRISACMIPPLSSGASIVVSNPNAFSSHRNAPTAFRYPKYACKLAARLLLLFSVMSPA
ncbi:hypothetical protein EV643_101149 [Kribbella sp. VKM Ac-2527]|uniref:Uncharacterized protein n=1 Tax=Kribbella caucasensis TaxID=2512215 RepID=A0A4R6KTL4_9ACTN|nr:hypothetical protein [Kribbella sp. VKM Ac-2527]TDO54367.1 hypothetical protein EV643_101149 [Kribbella sp. VKM Ac-2527]